MELAINAHRYCAEHTSISPRWPQEFAAHCWRSAVILPHASGPDTSTTAPVSPTRIRVLYRLSSVANRPLYRLGPSPPRGAAGTRVSRQGWETAKSVQWNTPLVGSLFKPSGEPFVSTLSLTGHSRSGHRALDLWMIHIKLSSSLGQATRHGVRGKCRIRLAYERVADLQTEPLRAANKVGRATYLSPSLEGYGYLRADSVSCSGLAAVERDG